MTTSEEGSSGLHGKGGIGKRSRKKELIRVETLNVSGINAQENRKEVVDMFKRGKINILGMSETHLEECGVTDGRDEDERELWEGLEGGLVWTGIGKGRRKEGCAIMVSPRVWAGIDGHGWLGPRIGWMSGKLVMVKGAGVCVYPPVNEKGVKGKVKLGKFWKELGHLLKKFENVRRVFLLGDTNARVGSTEIRGVLGKFGVDGMNDDR